MSSILSAMGSRNAPRRLSMPWWRATQPSSRSVSEAIEKTRSAQPGLRSTRSVTNTGISRMRRTVSPLARPIRPAQCTSDAVRGERTCDRRGQLHLQLDVAVLVVPIEDAAALVAEGHRGAVPVWDAQRERAAKRTHHALDHDAQPIESGTAGRGHCDGGSGGEQRLDGARLRDAIHLVEDEHRGPA